MSAPVAARDFAAAMRPPPAAPSWWETRSFMLVAVLATGAPLLWPALPPLVDLPGHVGRFRVMLGDGGPALAQWYDFHWRLVGNLGVDLLVRALAPLIGLEPAVKAIALAIPILTALGMLRVARAAHGRITPFALFALPLAYNFAFQFGFLNYTLGMALALNAFASWVAMADRPRARAAAFVVISLVVWLCHVVAWGVLGLVIGACELARARQRGRGWVEAGWGAALATLPLAPPLLLLVAWRSANGGGAIGYWGRIDLKLSWLSMVLRDRWMAFDIATTAILFTLLYRAARDPRLRFDPAIGAGALALLAALLILPGTLFGSAYADMRLAPYTLALALLAVRPTPALPRRARARLALAGAVFFGVRLVAGGASYAIYDASYARELAALDHVPRGARLVSFVGSWCAEPWTQSRLDHLPGLAIARRSAFSNDQWPLAGAPLLTVRAAGISAYANDPSQLVLAAPCAADPNRLAIADALRSLPRDRFDYVWLIRPPRFDPRLLAGMSAVWRGGDSALYRIDRREPR